MLKENIHIKSKSLNIYLASPRGFCAGVERAINIVQKTLKRYGPPIYVRHEIVHNQYVVDMLKKRGVIFVKELYECPVDKPVIFSAHGVSSAVYQEAKKRNMIYIDATCPLVSKVHKEAEYYARQDIHILLIGHKGHPEIIGTIGRVPKGTITLIETENDFLNIPKNKKLALITQTTLSVNETKILINKLIAKHPNILLPKKEDICYATTNRQKIIYEIAKEADAVFIIGDPTSSNSQRLVEVAHEAICPIVHLIQNANDININEVKNLKTIGLTASASTPETLVTQILNFFTTYFHTIIKTCENITEKQIFKLPKI